MRMAKDEENERRLMWVSEEAKFSSQDLIRGFWGFKLVEWMNFSRHSVILRTIGSWRANVDQEWKVILWVVGKSHAIVPFPRAKPKSRPQKAQRCVPISVCQVSKWFSSHGWKWSSSYGDADGWKWSPLANKCRCLQMNLWTLPTILSCQEVSGFQEAWANAALHHWFNWWPILNWKGFPFPWLYLHRSEGSWL